MLSQIPSTNPVCGRCGGFMTSEWVNGVHGDPESRRCVICGERVAPVILANRQGFQSLFHDRHLRVPRDARWLHQRLVSDRSGRKG